MRLLLLINIVMMNILAGAAFSPDSAAAAEPCADHMVMTDQRADMDCCGNECTCDCDCLMASSAIAGAYSAADTALYVSQGALPFQTNDLASGRALDQAGPPPKPLH